LLPVKEPLNEVLAVMKLAVTALPDKLPLNSVLAVILLPVKEPLNEVVAVIKLAVTALPERLPLNSVLAVTKLPVTAVPDKLPRNIGDVRALVFASNEILASVTSVKPIDDPLLVFTNVGKYVPATTAPTVTAFAVEAYPEKEPLNVPLNVPPVNVVAVIAVPVMLASMTPYEPLNTSLTLVPDGMNVNLCVDLSNPKKPVVALPAPVDHLNSTPLSFPSSDIR